ncbi:uncharacterized protein LOC134831962 [Culicoides brevitarsis]|uniref:uncharacterized protein LOC134831962 n=1 Tax=Culicoides brevitarsis TaxID=469753 RepID=UPI00307C755B
MFSKVFVVLATVVYASAAPQHAAQYPAGVDPSKCPGFPICDNAALHGVNPAPYSAPSYHQPQYYQQPAAQNYDETGAYDPRYNDPNFQGPQSYYQPAAPAHYQAPAHHYQPAPQAYAAPVSNHIAQPAADKYPAGVSPHACPNYPYCDINAGHAGQVRAAPLQGFTERLYPAGVNPASCPNFPDCPIGH